MSKDDQGIKIIKKCFALYKILLPVKKGYDIKLQFRKIKDWGECRAPRYSHKTRRKEIIIVLRKDQTDREMIDTFIHEYAHGLCASHHPKDHNLDHHSHTWGAWYSVVYKAFDDILSIAKCAIGIK